MNETIGIKGGHQDRIRTMRIDQTQMKKLQDYQEEIELKKLEEDVKKKQRMILVKVLPIVIAGEIFQVLYDGATGKKRIDKQDEYSKWKIKEYDADFTTRARGEKPKSREKIVVLPDGRKVTIVIPIVEEDVKEEKEEKVEELKPVVEEKSVEKPVIVEEKPKEVTPEISPIPISFSKESVEEKKEVLLKKEEPIESREEVVTPSQEIDSLSEELTPEARVLLGKLKNRKIIDEYEKQLKDIRFELRNLVFEYKVLEEEGDSLLFSKDADKLLDRLSDVIRKIEILKEKIKIDRIEDFDDNYIYTLIEEYLSEFQDKKLVKNIKDSPLYVLIAEKIDEITDRKDQFQKEVEGKKNEYSEREKRFEELKEKFYQFDHINRELEDFQRNQERIAREIQEKVKNAVTVKERVEVQANAMTVQSRRLLRLMTLSLLLPGNRSAKKMAASAAAYLYFVRRIMNPPTTTRKYQVVTVQDYSSDIEYSLSEIENANDLLKKTDRQVDLMIQEIKTKFRDYFGVLPECDELLANLEKVKSDLHEKEYEMDKVKKQQQHLLEENDAKVLKRGEYPM